MAENEPMWKKRDIYDPRIFGYIYCVIQSSWIIDLFVSLNASILSLINVVLTLIRESMFT